MSTMISRGLVVGLVAAMAALAGAVSTPAGAHEPAAPQEPAPAQEAVARTAEAAGTVAVVIPDSGLQIQVPAAWRPGVMRGAGTILHYMGSGDGFPHFSVQSDPGAQLPAETSEEATRLAVEELFGAIVEATGAEVVEADWTELAGIAVHSSTTQRDSVTGRLQMRRLLLVANRIPFVLVWGERAPRYAEIAELIERCVGSLRVVD